MRPELDPLVAEYQHEHHRPRQAEALQALRKIASLVKPIMRQRNWRVGALCEFFPQQTNLLGLNINHGEKICLRLRYPGDETQFLPIEQVTDTMLHELCHNVIGPHNEQFHALWNQLRDEHEALVRKGYTGEGFLGNGQRVGGSGRIPMHEARRQATAAAERRRQLYAGSGQKLGGVPVQRGTDIRRVIADAAQRRITIEKGCASNTDAGRQIAHDVERNVNGFRTKAEEDDANERAIMQAYIDLIQEEEKEKYGDAYVPPSENNPAGPRASSVASPPPIPTSSKPTPHPRPTPALPQPEPIDLTSPPRTPPQSDLATWTCPVCTLVNPIQYLQCDACLSERPTQPTNIATSSSSLTPNSKTPSSKQKPKSQTSANNASASTSTSTSTAFLPRLPVTESLARIRAQEEAKPSKPMGWICAGCENWMEQEWWTCARCGRMKVSS